MLKSNRPIVFHFRSLPSKCFERGGITIAYNPDSRSYGAAVCSHKENFNRKIGRTVALGRTLSGKHILSHSQSEDVTFDMVRSTAIIEAEKLAKKNRQKIQMPADFHSEE